MGGFSIYAGSWGTWLSAVWLSVCLCVCVNVICPCVFMKCILGATLAVDLSVQTGCLLCLSLSGVCSLCTRHTHACTHPPEEQIEPHKGIWHLSIKPAVSSHLRILEVSWRVGLQKQAPEYEHMRSFHFSLMSDILSTAASNLIMLWTRHQTKRRTGWTSVIKFMVSLYGLLFILSGYPILH